MITFDYSLNYGFALGFLIAEKDEAEEHDLDWGVIIFLGPISLFIEKEKI